MCNPASAIERITPEQDQLERGGVVLRTESAGSTRYVTGQILILEPPENIWPVLANPFEFRRSIVSRMQDLDIIVDEPQFSCLKTRIKCGLFPSIVYVVESRYVRNQRVDFRRIRGTFRDFNGYWSLTPSLNGTGTVVTFSVFVDPGLPVPQWLIREAIKYELPSMLSKLRKRVMAVSNGEQPPMDRSIVAAAIEQPK